MVSKIDNALSFQSQALGLRAHRQQILAGNIANADTPNFKARDFDFSTALKEAVAAVAAVFLWQRPCHVIYRAAQMPDRLG